MIIHYWVREWSESWEFPEVHMFRDETVARTTMVAEAFELATRLGGWVTEVMDGPKVRMGKVSPDVTALNVQQDGGAVDCFRLNSQELA